MRLQFVFSWKRSLDQIASNLNSQLLTLAQIKFDWKPEKTSNGLPTHCLLKCAAFSYYRKFSVSREYQIVTASMLGIQDARCLNKTCRTWHSFKGRQALFYPNVGRLCRSFIHSQLDIHTIPIKMCKDTPNKTHKQIKLLKPEIENLEIIFVW